VSTFKDRRREQLYAEQMGREALERQLRAAQLQCSRCGGKEGRHHQLCPRQPRDAA